MKKTGLILFLVATVFLTARFATTVDRETVTQFLKDYKIIASKPDIYYSYDRISKTYPWGLIAKKDDVYFMTDPDGNKINERGFQKIGSFNDYGLAEVENSEGMVGLINTAGELIADTAYYDINPFGEDELAIVEVLIPYDSSGSGDSQQVSYKGREGLISTAGELVVEPEYFNITYREDVALYHINYYYYGEKLGSRNSLFSATDGWLENSTYDSIGKFENGVAVVTKDGLDGLIDTKAETIIPPMYNNVFEASEGLLRVDNTDDQSAFFDIEGNIVIPFRDYRIPTHFKHGISIVLSPDSNFSRRKAALMDRTGEMLTDYIYDDFEPFNHYEDIDRVLTMAGPHGSRFNGLIDTAGNYVVAPKYSDIEYDKAGYFRTVTFVFSEERNTPTKKF
ncbi:WG repeat-containing protein [Saccharospirillum impatiens]|uniref:WG repeat-containing protein n=1 Tax=Saccharospirillum impatiens TaxID=169438 RepID=UPI000428541C|nr:WG repeat-containing protein [Saccharospirillum impatiens]